MRNFLWMAACLAAVTLPACQKSLVEESQPTASTPSTKTASAFLLVVGLPPAIVWWGTAPNLPFSDGEPGDTPGGDLYPLGFAINETGYVVGSVLFDSHASARSINNMFKFDIPTQTWMEVAPIPGIAPVEASCFVIGDDAYVVNPDDGTTRRYNQPANTWSLAATLPFAPERFNSTAFAVNGKGYVGLGYGEPSNGVFETFNDWWEYDPATNGWTKKHNFPGGRRNSSAGFAVDGKGYVCSGEKRTGNVDSYPNDLWQYDPTSDTWVQKANMPGLGFAATGLDGIVNSGVHYGFVVAGGPGGCLLYNPATDTWGTLPDVPGGSRHNFAAFMINRSLVIGGGSGGSFGYGRMDVHSLNWSK